ncbi:MAG: glutamate--tRNA ligase [Myxococcota bacterium]|jgi:glutamyl-tRNA synthetase|nr:glutamate--tRNA ligase [Myxococcota bacterium]
MSVRVRFAPSPTGFMHLGNARTALFNWLFARHMGGTFLLRIEDTDRVRSTKEAVQVIFDTMRWLGLNWDEEVLFQSQRLELYHQHAQQLIDQGFAYRCTCSKEELEQKKEQMRESTGQSRYDRSCREKNLGPDCGEHVIRFKTPLEGYSSFDDLIQGTIRKGYDERDDFIMIRSDNMPTYQFAVVVDDIAMNISHVIRGADHIDNTHDQLLLYQALQRTPPRFGHAPRILGLSKRKGSPSVEYYRKEFGLTAEGLINYIARLGWSHQDQEIFSMEELVEHFTIEGVNQSNAAFDDVKLAWVNEQQLRKVSIERLAEQVLPFYAELGIQPEIGPWFYQLLELYRIRAHSLIEIAQSSAYFFNDPSSYDEKAASKHLTPTSRELLAKLATALNNVKPWTHEAIEQALHGFCQEQGTKLGKIAQPSRVALTGVAEAPGIYDIFVLLGKEASVRRLNRAAQPAY